MLARDWKLIRTRLRVLRAERDLNQTEVGQKARMGKDRYMRIELGYADPTPEEKARIARVFGLTAADVFEQPSQAPVESR